MSWYRKVRVAATDYYNAGQGKVTIREHDDYFAVHVDDMFICRTDRRGAKKLKQLLETLQSQVELARMRSQMADVWPWNGRGL